MNFDDFRNCLERHGARLDLWPASHCDEATRFMQSHDDARALFAKYADFDARVRKHDPGATIDPESERRVLRFVEDRMNQAPISSRAFGPRIAEWFRAFVATGEYPKFALPMGLSAAAGLVVGILLPTGTAQVAAWTGYSPVFTAFAMLGY